METNSGIYVFWSNDDEPLYIGSSEDIDARLIGHVNELNRGKHINSKMQSDWPFEYTAEIYHPCKGTEMMLLENELIHKINPKYNVTKSVLSIEITDNLIKRMFDKIEIKSIDACWISNRSKSQDGYPKLIHQKKTQLVHRIMYYLYHDVWPAGAVVRHMCHNKLCCNPTHLKLGSHADNMKDNIKKRKKTGYKITRNVKGKIPEEDVKRFVELYQEGKTLREIASIYNTDNAKIYNVLSGKSKCYRHLIPEDFKLRPSQSKHPFCKENIDRLHEEHNAEVSKSVFKSRLKRGISPEVAAKKKEKKVKPKKKTIYNRTPEEERIIEETLKRYIQEFQEMKTRHIP